MGYIMDQQLQSYPPLSQSVEHRKSETMKEQKQIDEQISNDRIAAWVAEGIQNHWYSSPIYSNTSNLIDVMDRSVPDQQLAGSSDTTTTNV